MKAAREYGWCDDVKRSGFCTIALEKGRCVPAELAAQVAIFLFSNLTIIKCINSGLEPTPMLLGHITAYNRLHVQHSV